MIKFKIFKGEKDGSEIVYIKQGDDEKQKLIFDVIRKISFDLLVKSIEGEDASYEIEVSDASLTSYKEILNTVFNSVIKDDELKDLYKETASSEKQAESTEE